MRTKAFSSQATIKAAKRAVTIGIFYCGLLFFASDCFSASIRKVSDGDLEPRNTAAVNVNFESVNRELSNCVHKTSTETIRGYKYFVDPVDFGTVTADSGTVTNFTASTGTFNFLYPATVTLSNQTALLPLKLDSSKRITSGGYPTVQKFTSGSGTYTTPSGVLYIRVRMVGGGGGGAGSSTNAANDGGSGGTGGNSTFGTTLLISTGGAGATKDVPGAGGTAGLGSGPIGMALTGGSGSGGTSSTLTTGYAGGPGGNTALGGGGGGGTNGFAGNDGATNTGGGGGGAGLNVSGSKSGPGGGAAGFVDAIITNPSSSYAYAVGSGGTAGTAGTSGLAGGAGGSGLIVVEEHYQ